LCLVWFYLKNRYTDGKIKELDVLKVTSYQKKKSIDLVAGQEG
jgi:hypothetical protein